MQKQLTKEEQEEFNKIKDNVLSEEGTAALCLKYYLGYRQNVNIAQDKISLAFRCAYFMAEKSQFTVNMKGEKVRNIAFSLNELLKSHKLDDTMFMLKQMTKKIESIDEDTSVYLNNVVKEISFLITLHSKFEKTFSQKLELKERVNENGSYTKTFTSFAWLLFIIMKNEALGRTLQLLPNTCMVAHIICSMLFLAWDYIKPEGLMRGDKRLHENSSAKDIKLIIKQKILEIFCIKDLGEYQKIAGLFEGKFNEMAQNFRTSENNWDFLSPEYININYRKLDKRYQDISVNENLDERIFFKQRTMNLTPSKFTPFARQGYANKYQKQPIGNKLGGVSKPSKQQTFNSHRVLNYQAIQKQVQTKSTPIHQLKLPKNIIQSPSMVKVPLVMATPISTGMQMYNYINEKKKRIREIHTHERSLDKTTLAIIDQIFQLQRNQNDKINKETKLELILALYKIFSKEYLAGSGEKDTGELVRAFVGLSMELVFFVSNISLTFEKIEQELQIQPFEMWKAIDYFLKSDKTMPFPIKLHFLDLQVNFVSYKIWQNLQMVKKISNFANKSSKEQPESQTQIQKLFKRTVHQVAFQITRLTTLLQIDETSSQRAFQIMKQVLTSFPELLYLHHLDQLILCSIYASIKGLYKIMFNEIKECYMVSNPNLKDIIQSIIVHVYINEDQPASDVIVFYNKMFVGNLRLKDFICNLRSNADGNTATNAVNKNSKKNTLLMSPMKAIIPKQINFKSKNIQGNAAGKAKNNNHTPQTQLLYAYNESPILKYEVNSFKAPLKSKKVLNYEQEEQKIKNRSYEEELGMKPTPSDNNISPHNNANNYQATNDYITKKYSRKATTPVSQHQPPSTHQPNTLPQSHCIQTMPAMQTMQTIYGHQHHQSQLQLPLQNITKENVNPPLSGNSHRTLFDDGACNGNGNNGIGSGIGNGIGNGKKEYQGLIKGKNLGLANFRRD